MVLLETNFKLYYRNKIQDIKESVWSAQNELLVLTSSGKYVLAVKL